MAAPDIGPVGDTLHRAFSAVFSHHGYTPPIQSGASGEALARIYHEYEPEGCFVAETGGEVVGAAFLHRRDDKASIGPVVVDPDYQGRGVGRRLMEHLIEESAGCRSLHLVQDAFNADSFALYARLGFEVRDMIAILRAEEGLVDRPDADAGFRVREMKGHDLLAVSAMDAALTRLARSADILFLLDRGRAYIGETDGALRAYLITLQIGDTLCLGPGVAYEPADLVRIVTTAVQAEHPRRVTLRVPARPAPTLRGLLDRGFSVRYLGAYMVRGEYEETAGTKLLAMFPEGL